ncbi:MAG: hypothetical protein DRP45_01840 [Candidatus Zixiibacteriota bacterium]|nr:MAG: hypothetical protein DRP45_01840 [candidate division Zixibacteria bacterium]
MDLLRGFPVDCRVSFKRPISDSSNIDTIPVIVIESICFSGDCLLADTCYTPLSTRDSDRQTMLEGIWKMWQPSQLEDIFIKEIPDSAEIAITPVFVIDSICFRGACIDEGYCHNPITGTEDNRLSMKRGYDLFGYQEPSPFEDVFQIWDGRIVHTSFLIHDGILVPLECKEKTIEITVHARLLERESGLLISRESRAATFRVKKSRNWYTI